MKRKLLPLLFLSSLAIFQACKKDHDDTSREIETKGIYVEYEGLLGHNNSGIAFYDLKTGETDSSYFKKVNGYDLGESASDLRLYGNKIYCVVSGIQGEKKSFLEVINPSTGKSLKRIDFNGEHEGFMPKSLAFYENKVYVSAYDGKIRRIDTTSLNIDGEVSAGGAMEGIAIVNKKIYAANSDHYLYPNATSKNTVSVIDVTSFQKIKEVSVSANPQKLIAAPGNKLWVICWGNYSNIAPSYQLIDAVNDQVTGTYTGDIAAADAGETKGYVLTDVYSAPAARAFDLTSGRLSDNFITDGTKLTTPYGITVNTLNGDVLISDSNNYSTTGKAICFSSDGKRKAEFKTGPNPSHAAFRYGYK